MPEGTSDERIRLIRLYMDGQTADVVPDVEERRPSEPEVTPAARQHVSRPTTPSRSPESSAKPPAANGSAILERPEHRRRRHRARRLRFTSQGGWVLAMISLAIFFGWLVAHA
jgi:hypothetical protein